jgi:hypothetical protein
MVRMAAGESHAWSWLARGWFRRSCFVFILYALSAFSKMTLKLEEEVDVAEYWDIELEAGD